MNNYSATEADISSLKQAVSNILPMSANDFENIIPLVNKKTVKKGELILRENAICQHIFFLCTGLVRMYYLNNEGEEISYRFTTEKNFFVDFQSFLTQQPSRFFWEALHDSELLQVSYASVQHIYKLHPSWNHFGRIIAERVYLQLNERVEMLLFMKPEERYLHILNTNPNLIYQVSLAHLSSYVGVRPESLSRIRKRLSGK